MNLLQPRHLSLRVVWPTVAQGLDLSPGHIPDGHIQASVLRLKALLSGELRRVRWVS